MTVFLSTIQLKLASFGLLFVLTPQPYGPIILILSSPMRAFKENEHSTPVVIISSSHFFIRSTSAFEDTTPPAQTLQPAAEIHVATTVPSVKNSPTKNTRVRSSVSVPGGTGLLLRSDALVQVYVVEAATSTRGRGGKPNNLSASTRLLRIIFTIALWLGFTVVVFALLMGAILTAVYGGLSLRQQ